MQSLREYAEQNGITYEAVRQQVAKNETELAGHVTKQGGTRYIDDEGAAILDRIRGRKHVSIIAPQADEEHRKAMEAAHETIRKLQAVIITKDEQIIKAQGAQIETSKALARLEMLEQTEADRRAEIEQAKEAQAQAIRAEERARQELEQIRSQAQAQEIQNKAALTELENARKEAQERTEREAAERAKMETERQEQAKRIQEQADELERIRAELEEARAEAGSYHKSIFGFFRKR